MHLPLPLNYVTARCALIVHRNLPESHSTLLLFFTADDAPSLSSGSRNVSTSTFLFASIDDKVKITKTRIEESRKKLCSQIRETRAYVFPIGSNNLSRDKFQWGIVFRVLATAGKSKPSSIVQINPLNFDDERVRLMFRVDR